MEREKKGFIEKTAGISKKIDLVQIAAGLVVGSSVVVALGVVGYFAGSAVENWSKKRSKK